MRCYNGCPDDELKALLDDEAAAGEEIAAAGLSATYFPMEGAWMLFNADHRAVSGFYGTRREAAIALAKHRRGS